MDVSKKPELPIKRGSFVATIIRNHMLFSVFLVILIYVVVLLVTINTFDSSINKNVKNLASDYSESAEFKNVNIHRYLNDNSGVVILDKNGKTVFHTGRCPIKEFTPDGLKLIPARDQIVDISVKKAENDDGQQVIFVRRIWTTDLYTDYVDFGDVDVLDSDHNVIYSTKFSDKTRYSPDEYKLLTGKLGKDISVRKTGFKKTSESTGKSEKYTLVAFSHPDFVSAMNRRERNSIFIILGTVAAYFALLMIFSLIISRKVKTPIHALEQAMSDVSRGKTGGIIVYEGPTEFMDMCHSFNTMSKKLQVSENENQEMREAQQRMISGVAHDLKTPITVIQGYAKAINDGIVAPEDQKKYLQTIEEKSTQLTELINEFHQYAMMNRPEMKFDLEKVNICEFTREYLAGRYQELDIERRELELDIPDEEIMVSIDQSHFTRVFDNLVNNYLRYCGEGSTLFCSIKQRDDKVLVIIGDNGPGVSENVISTIFDPFVKGDSARASRGSGLGLSIVKEVIEGCGGTIVLTKHPRKPMNTEFIITLPVK